MNNAEFTEPLNKLVGYCNTLYIASIIFSIIGGIISILIYAIPHYVIHLNELIELARKT